MDNDKFPLIILKGSPEEIGYQHGKLLKNRIEKSIKYYKSIFKKSEIEIFEEARLFKQKIIKFNEDYAIEIEAIAEGAKTDPLWIYALNSRSEILNNTINPDECTALFYSQSSLLGQNWDWSQELESLAVLMKIIKKNGQTILMMTEPGIIGKIGMNSSGIGVCLNILRINKKLEGVPIHIILRSVLDSTSIEQARNIIDKYQIGKASNILIGDSRGNYCNIEFAGDNAFYMQDPQDVTIHTNHYLSKPELNTDAEKLASSFSRFRVASKLAKDRDNYSINNMKNILSDVSDAELPICRKYLPSEDIGNVGTVCTIIMDLINKQLQITLGNPFNNDFEIFSI